MIPSKYHKYFWAYLMLFPGLLILGLVMFYPFVQNVIYSFTDYSLINRDFRFVGFQNYLNVLVQDEFLKSLYTTLVWVILNILFILFFGLVTAFVLRSNLKGSFILQFFLLIPWILPELVTGYTWKLLLSFENGIYIRMLESIGLLPPKVDLFSNSFTAMLAVVFANVWRSFPIMAITTYAKLKTLPTEQVEAGIVDGAKRWHIFRYIEWPHISSTVKSTTFLCFVWTFNAFGIIYVMTGGGPLDATEVISIILQRVAFNLFDFSRASAMSVTSILTLVITVVIIFSLAKINMEKSGSRADDGKGNGVSRR